MLITACLCGGDKFEHMRRNGLTIAACSCGVQHLVSALEPEAYAAQYRGDYHRAVDRHPGCIPYHDRYRHDRRVAERRWQRYTEILGDELELIGRALDVGAANGAWVDLLAEKGVQAYGIDPDPAMARGTIRTALVHELADVFDLVTYHDVLEHTLDPAAELGHARNLCASGALLVVDVPDVSVEAGHHHYKAEHPWYFNETALRSLFAASAFEVLASDKPLPGKLVVYGRAV